MLSPSPELVVAIMFGCAIVGILLGFPLAFTLGGIAVVFGLLTLGSNAVGLFRARIWTMMIDYSFLAAPLFIFMGLMVEESGAADRLYGALHILSGRLTGGLAVATILMGTLLAACVGVIAASVIMIGLIATPNMLRRGYSKELIAGSVCAGGTLGILIPPSIMLVIYGPLASLSVGKLFMGAFGPGLLLSALYMAYILVRCGINPKLAPPLPREEFQIPFTTRLRLLVTGIAPPLLLMVSVLGVIFLGIAAPTEAAAVGAAAATILAALYGRLHWNSLRGVVYKTMWITSMALFIGWGATMFTGLFLRLGGNSLITELVLSAPFGKWGSFATIMFVIFLLGMLIDWIGILFIMIPLVSPIVPILGFDPIWFAMMICVNLQMSFLTPPMAYAIFYLRGILKPEWGIVTEDIIRGVIPYVGLIALAILLCVAFPDIILWLPGISKG